MDVWWLRLGKAIISADLCVSQVTIYGLGTFTERWRNNVCGMVRNHFKINLWERLPKTVFGGWRGLNLLAQAPSKRQVHNNMKAE